MKAHTPLTNQTTPRSYQVLVHKPLKGAVTVTAKICRDGYKVPLFSVKGLVSELASVEDTARAVCQLLTDGFTYVGARSNIWWQRFSEEKFIKEHFNEPS